MLGAATVMAACRLWYRPVPVAAAIGTQRVVVAGDTFRVHRDDRFEVYGPGAQPVYDAYEQLNRTYRTFARYFGPPPRLGVVLIDDPSDALPSAVDDALRTRGLVPLRYTRPMRARLRERQGDVGYEGSLWPIGPAAARVMLATLARSSASTTSSASAASAALDTAALAAFPAWFRSAVMSVVGDANSLPADLEYVHAYRDSRWSLEQLFSIERPTSADSALDPSRRDDGDGDDRRFAAQASAVAQFLIEREGAEVLLVLARGFAAGRSFEEIAAEFKGAPPTIAELEERWLNWLAARRRGDRWPASSRRLDALKRQNYECARQKHDNIARSENRIPAFPSLSSCFFRVNS